jgi:hypothetical protein
MTIDLYSRLKPNHPYKSISRGGKNSRKDLLTLDEAYQGTKHDSNIERHDSNIGRHKSDVFT